MRTQQVGAKTVEVHSSYCAMPFACPKALKSFMVCFRFVGACVVLILLLAPLEVRADPGKAVPTGFVGAEGTHFVLDGKPLFIAGINNHYLTFGSQSEVTRVLDDAVAMRANVVRTFLQPVIGSPQGDTPKTIWNWRKRTYSSEMGVHGNYMVYWDTSLNAMGINEGPNGLQKLDFLVNEARKRDLKLIIALVDFWAWSGGAQQMRAWYGSEDKFTFFFQDPRTKDDYKTLVRTVLLRKNTITGVRYKDDPTIFAWDLINEGNAIPQELRLSWTREMAAYVKSIDSNHILTSGHANIDTLLDINIPGIDFATWHGYPLYYKWTVDDMDKRIDEYCAIAARAKKPVILEEFGYPRSEPDAADAYRKWVTSIYRNPNCAGWVVWRLVSLQDDLRFPIDPLVQFDIRRDVGPLWTILRDGAQQMHEKGEAMAAKNSSEKPR